jgi:fatty-acyl-CoA synthase
MRGFDAGAVLQAINDPSLGITHFFGVPSAWQFMTQHELFASTDFGRIVLAGVGGAPVPPPLLEQWQSRGVSIQNGFGMTETSPSVTTLAADDAIRKVGSIGKPLLHTEVKLMLDDGTEAAVDEPGEIWIRGPNVTPGYWRRPEANQAAFVDGWLRSGDIGRRDADGFIFILDRKKDMYISGGENVYPAEVESVLMRLGAIAAVAVIGISDDRWGETGLAVIASRPGSVLSKQEILSHCASHLARFKHPSEIVFVEQLPLTASGKVHKPTLRERFSTRKLK